MDGERFDGLTKALAGGISRRTILRGLAGGMAAALGGGAAAARAGQAKQPLCHSTGDPAHPYTVVEVAEPAWETHLAHGDAPYVNCCPGDVCPGPGATCGGGGVPGACGCTPDNAAACQGQNCGTAVNNCGQSVSCGTCAAPLSCGGGGIANVCGCTPEPAATTCAGRCGTVTNTCGLTVECPACCTPTTCDAAGAECGSLADGCGGTLQCGSCASPETCGGGDPGVANVCGCTPEPAWMTCGTRRCGTAVNNCGQTVSCGTCQSPNTCEDGQCLCAGQSCAGCIGGCVVTASGDTRCAGAAMSYGRRCTTDAECPLEGQSVGYDRAYCQTEGQFASYYGGSVCLNEDTDTCPATAT